jgi:hypothetical protein
MGYPHWLIVAGAALVAIGVIGLALRRELIGIALRRNRGIEPNQEPTDMNANWQPDGRDPDTAALPPWPQRPPPQAR